MHIMRTECAVARGVWGHAPPGNFWNFRRSEIDSGAFGDTCTSWKGTCTNELYAVGIIVDAMSRNQVVTLHVLCACAQTTP